ncbi:peptidoglycan-associated lipoprotein Pal [Alphaproteobacteria bacterium]|nr:peptidoglycan-associated lipoprotein Pal [Alphaproteobacteria bacterium]MDA7560319.1 peptidoglycan-associated lipoprotein Pal [Alphaproteobacteria bacterium]MDC3294251.1 peptidoglycan-associated lipoprotein Pal [Alphaproteobacteria bacterium]
MCAVAFLFTACETASNVAGDSASGSSSSSATAAGSTSSSASSSTTATQMSDAEKLAQVGNTVYFGFDSSELAGEAQATLDRQAAFLNVNPTMVVIIEGHADERGTREYNLALGDRRAVAVRDYLLAKGLNAARVRTVSYGKERPAVSGSNEEAWAKNRRAATVLN